MAFFMHWKQSKLKVLTFICGALLYAYNACVGLVGQPSHFFSTNSIASDLKSATSVIVSGDLNHLLPGDKGY
jgi:hypothetical protein